MHIDVLCSCMQYTVNDDNWAMDGGLSGLPVMENEYRCAPQLPFQETPSSKAATGRVTHAHSMLGMPGTLLGGI